MSVKTCARCLPWLKKLAKARSSKTRKKLFKIAPQKVLKAIKEIIRNIVNGKIKLKSSQKTSLHRYKNVLRRLSNNNYTVKKQKQILIQKGGFLPNLLLPIITLLASTLADNFLK